MNTLVKDGKYSMVTEDVIERLRYLIAQLNDAEELQKAARDIHEFCKLVNAHQETNGTVQITPGVANAGLYTRGFLKLRELTDKANALKEFNLSAFLTSLMRLAIFFDYPIPFNLHRQKQINASGKIRPQYDPSNMLDTAS